MIPTDTVMFAKSPALYHCTDISHKASGTFQNCKFHSKEVLMNFAPKVMK
jgi:hypothetical protein